MEVRFDCKHCLKKFKSKDSRHHHLSKYHGYEPISYKCTHCPKSFKYKHSYMTHLSDGHKVPNMRFECGQCTSSFKYAHHLVQHMRLVHDPDKKSYKCPECSKTFERRDGFVQHMKIHAPTLTLHRCELCQRMYRSKAGLTLHVNMNHNENFQRSQCPWCPSDFKWPHHLKQHISKVHFKPNQTLGDVKHSKSLGNRCGLCLVSFPGKLELLLHLKKYHHLDVDIFKCCQCTEVFNLKEPLQQHLEKHQERDNFTHKCEQCYPVINPQLYVDSTSDLNMQSPDHEMRPEDEILDFEVCLMEHPELRRMIRYKMRHGKTNDSFFSNGYFEAPSEDEDEDWNPLAEDDVSQDNFNRSEVSYLLTPQEVPEIILTVERDETICEDIPPLNNLLSNSNSAGNTSDTSLNFSLPESDTSINSICRYSCCKCEASFGTANSLSVHVEISHKANPEETAIDCSQSSLIPAIHKPTDDSLDQENHIYLAEKEKSSFTPTESSILRLKETAVITDTRINENLVGESLIQEQHHEVQAVDSLINRTEYTVPESTTNTADSSPSPRNVVKNSKDKELVVKLQRLKKIEVHASANGKQTKDGKTHVKCSKCTAVLKTVESLKEHEAEIHSKEQLIFKCAICNKFFAKKAKFDKHLETHKPDIARKEIASEESLLKTLYLSKRLRRRKVVIKSNLANFKKSKNIKCKQCNLTFKTPLEVARHVRFFHVRNTIDSNSKQKPRKGLQCKHCSKKFSRPQALALHSRIHCRAAGNYSVTKQSVSPLSNDFNQNVNSNEVIEKTLIVNSEELSNLGHSEESVHVNDSNVKKPKFHENQKDKPSDDDVYECGKCKLFFTSKLKLLRHISDKHMNIKNVSSQKHGVLKENAQSCTSEKTHAEKETILANNSKTKPHFCISCDQLFNHETDFNLHMKMEHRHKCGICGIAFVRKEKLRNHISTQHKDRPQQYKCDECSAIFRLETSLAKHMDEKHQKPVNQENTNTMEPQLVTREMEKVMHKCVHCSALFPLRESLQRHIQLEHDVGSLHKCGECTAVFNDIEEFKEHLQIEHMRM